jgi:hypothetical protein
MVTVVIFYALCWLPLHTITLVGDHNPTIYNNKYIPILWLGFHWLSMSNSCYNPIIYLWMSPKFRAGLRMSLNNCCQKKQTTLSSDEEIYQKIQIIFLHLRYEFQMEENMSNKRSTRQKIKDLKSGGYIFPESSIHSDTWSNFIIEVHQKETYVNHTFIWKYWKAL